jgi:hypothetical protein
MVTRRNFMRAAVGAAALGVLPVVALPTNGSIRPKKHNSYCQYVRREVLGLADNEYMVAYQMRFEDVDFARFEHFLMLDAHHCHFVRCKNIPLWAAFGCFFIDCGNTYCDSPPLVWNDAYGAQHVIPRRHTRGTKTFQSDVRRRRRYRLPRYAAGHADGARIADRAKSLQQGVLGSPAR